MPAHSAHNLRCLARKLCPVQIHRSTTRRINDGDDWQWRAELLFGAEYRRAYFLESGDINRFFAGNGGDRRCIFSSNRFPDHFRPLDRIGSASEATAAWTCSPTRCTYIRVVFKLPWLKTSATTSMPLPRRTSSVAVECRSLSRQPFLTVPMTRIARAGWTGRGSWRGRSRSTSWSAPAAVGPCA